MGDGTTQSIFSMTLQRYALEHRMFFAIGDIIVTQAHRSLVRLVGTVRPSAYHQQNALPSANQESTAPRDLLPPQFALLVSTVPMEAYDCPAHQAHSVPLADSAVHVVAACVSRSVPVAVSFDSELFYFFFEK